MATCCTAPPRERLPLYLLPPLLVFLLLLLGVTVFVLLSGAVIFLALLLLDAALPGRVRRTAPIVAFLRRSFPAVRHAAGGLAIVDARTVCRVSARIYLFSPYLGGLCYKYLNGALLLVLAAALGGGAIALLRVVLARQ